MHLRLVAWTLVAFSAGCSKPTTPSGLPSTLVLSYSPLPLEAIEFTVPIGNLNPPDHTLSTDHAYFYTRLFHPSAPAYDVVAPAGGTVRDVRRENDDVVRIEATPTHTYYLAHLKLDAAIARGMTVTAGQHLGVTSNLAFGIDLGLVNDALTLPFIAPARYSGDTLHADSPFKYFAEPIRSALYAKERGTGAQPDGRIDFDVAGTLAGNWFLEGLTGQQSTVFGSGTQQLAFVRDVDDASAVRISIGGTVSMAGVFAIAPGAPDPATVTTASGKTVYQLFFANQNTVRGLLIVQLLDAGRIRVETFAGSQATNADFTGQARIYLR